MEKEVIDIKKLLIDYIRENDQCNYADFYDYLKDLNQCDVDLKAHYLTELLFYIHKEEQNEVNNEQNTML